MNPSPTDFDITAFLKNLTQSVGIYKMLNQRGEILYIGKAKNLKNRVSSYFRKTSSPKQRAMVAKIARIEVTVTYTEAEALILESQQIKRHKPRYNICLRDDKSYPYLFVSTEHPFPRISLHRGAKKKGGKYFGPYPSVGAVKTTLKQLQAMFPIRQCEDSYYNHRTRPCLQYQIKRCTAPCVGLINKENYAEDVSNTLLFLQGQGGKLIDQLIGKMEQASYQLAFEQAAVFRDQIARLRHVLEKHFIQGEKGDMDIVACANQQDIACIQVFFIRNGQSLANQQFFPKIVADHTPAGIIQAFIAQYYLERPAPHELIVSHALEETDLLIQMLNQSVDYPVTIADKVRGTRLKWLQMAQMNADNALISQLADKQGLHERYLSLQKELGCVDLPQRLECFDISHTQGGQTVASCVVFDYQGAVKSAYRRFNIEGITAGDDYAAIFQAVQRRFKRLKKGEHLTPDILFIDGGRGQVKQAQKALTALAVNNVMIVGVSKGVDRKAGMEKLILLEQTHPLKITPNASALLLIQQIRDEAHRFALTGHRQRRAKVTKQSVLESIAGIGSKRRQRLLKQFGGLQGVSDAGVESLSSINGISQQLAQRIYDTFHH